MHLLVIGAGGFIGAHVSVLARAAGLDVTTAGRHPTPGSPAHEIVDLATDSAERVAAVLRGVVPDVVVNCAGATSGSPEAMAATNITGTFTLTEAMFLAGFAGRLVHLGSAAEYGRTEMGTSVRESMPPQPVGVYGATKLGGTRLVQLAAAAGLEAVVLRVFNPIGPGASEESLAGRLAAELHRALLHGTDVRIGSVDAVRDFVDVRDVAEAVIAAARAPRLPHSILNVGSGVGVSVRALVEQLVAISGWTSSLLEDAPGSTRSPDVPWQRADIATVSADLAWQPHRDLVTSLRDLWSASS